MKRNAGLEAAAEIPTTEEQKPSCSGGDAATAKAGRSSAWEPAQLEKFIECLPRLCSACLRHAQNSSACTCAPSVRLPKVSEVPLDPEDASTSGRRLTDLGKDVLTCIASFLPARDLACFASTCKLMRVAAAFVRPPGLREHINLLPHQQSVNAFLSRVGRSAMILDEPGTGKTLSVISYILRTKGRLPMLPGSSSLLFAEEYEAQELGSCGGTSDGEICGYLRPRSLKGEWGGILSTVAGVSRLRAELAVRLSPLRDRPTVGELCTAVNWILAVLEGNSLLSLTIEAKDVHSWQNKKAVADSVFEILDVMQMEKVGAEDSRASRQYACVGIWAPRSPTSFPSMFAALNILFSSLSTFETNRYTGSKADNSRRMWSNVQWMESDRFVFLSSCTLVVAPSSLVHQWKKEIDSMTIEEDDACRGISRLRVMTCASGRDDFGPPARIAWDYDVILTSFERLSQEWSRRDSPLLRVHFLRVVLDEGHKLGKSFGTPLNHHAMACKIVADQRIVMTGTPTPTTSTALQHLQPLLDFIRHPIMQRCENPQGASGSACGHGEGKMCWKHVYEGFHDEARREAATRSLCDSLRGNIIRNLKQDICGLGGLVRHPPTLVAFTEAQAHTYNMYCLTIMRNLLLADWYDPNHIESYITAASEIASVRSPETPKRKRNLLTTYTEYIDLTEGVDVRLEDYNWYSQGRADTVKQRDEMINSLRTACCVGGTAVARMYCSGCHRLFCDTCGEHAPWNSSNRSCERCQSCKTWEAMFPGTRWCYCLGGPLDLKDYSIGDGDIRTMSGGGKCESCQRHYPAVGLMCTPCSHVICVACISEDRFRCRVCHKPYRQQDPIARPEEGNPNPQHSVPQELIEQQASFVTKMMDEDGTVGGQPQCTDRDANGGGGGAAEKQSVDGEQPHLPPNIRLYAQSSKFKLVLQQVRIDLSLGTNPKERSLTRSSVLVHFDRFYFSFFVVVARS